MMKKRIFKTVLIALIAIGSITPVYSQTLDGRQIIEKVYNRDQGRDQQLELIMILIDKRGNQRVRQMREFKKISNNGKKSVTFFITPADIKNIAYLSYSYNSNQSNEQWLYIPAIGKPKKVLNNKISDSFMGGEYTYADYGSRKIDDDTHQLLREENVNNKACYVVESVSKNKGYLYSKTITWIDKSTFIIVKKELFDKGGKLLKILSINETKEFAGYLMITKSEMKNVKTNKRTVFRVNNVKINQGVKDELFTIKVLKRGL